ESEWSELVEIAKNARTHFRLELVHPPTLTQLRSRLSHTTNAVLCYMGHGSAKPQLDLESETGDIQCITAEDLAEATRGNNVGLFLLSACHSHHTARILVQRGVPFAIGAIRQIPDAVARAFTKAFLENLWQGKTMTDALGRARMSAKQVDLKHP